MGINSIGIRNERGQSLANQTTVSVQSKKTGAQAAKFQMKPMAKFANAGVMPLAVIARSLSSLRQDPGTKKPTRKKIQKWTRQLYARDREVRTEAADCLIETLPKGRVPFRAYLVILSQDWRALDVVYIYAWQKAKDALIFRGVPTLLRLLRNRNAKTRKIAAMVLGSMEDEAKRAVPALIRRLRDRDEGVRLEAANALESIALTTLKLKIFVRVHLIQFIHYPLWSIVDSLVSRGRSIIPELIRFLRSRRAEMRDAAAQVLSKFGPAARSAIPRLGKLLGDRDADVRSSAADALTSIGRAAIPTFVRALSNRNSKIRTEVAEVIGKIGPTAKAAVPTLVGLLSDRNAPVRYAAAVALSKVDPTNPMPAKTLSKALQHSLREGLGDKEAVKALGRMGPAAKAAVPALIQSIYYRIGGVEALGKIGPAARAAVPALVGTLGTSDIYLQRQAAEALGKIGPAAKAAVPALVGVIRGIRDTYLQRQAAEALGKIGPAAKAAVPALINKLYDDSDYGYLALAAEQALVNIGPAAVPRLLKAVGDGSKAAARALIKIGPAPKAVVPSLITFLSYYNRAANEAAADVLASIGPAAQAAVPALIRCVYSGDGELRSAAVQALSKIKPALKATMVNIARLLDDGEYATTKSKAATALGTSGPYRKIAVPALITALRHRNAGVRAAAASALGKIGPAAKTAIPALVSRITDKFGSVKKAAFDALAKIGPVAIPTLIKFAVRHKINYDEVVGTLYRMGSAGYPAIIRSLAHRDPALRSIVIGQFYKIRMSSTFIKTYHSILVPSIIKALGYSKDSAVDKRNLIELLGKVGPAASSPSVYTALGKLLKDPDKDVREAAALALNKI